MLVTELISSSQKYPTSYPNKMCYACQFYMHEPLNEKATADEDRKSIEENWEDFPRLYSKKNSPHLKYNDSLLKKYHTLGNGDENLSEFQEIGLEKDAQYNRHQRFVEKIEKEFNETKYDSTDESGDETEPKIAYEFRDITNEGYSNANNSFSSCSGYCSMLEDEEIAYENDVFRKASSEIDVSQRKMTNILKYYEFRKSVATDSRFLDNDTNMSFENK